MKFKLFLITIISFFSIGIIAQTPAATVPQFSFLKNDKTEFNNKDLSIGTKLFFVFFDTECEHCRHAISYIDKNYKQFSKVSIYLITLDDASKTDPFLAKYGSRIKAKNNVTILQDYKSEFIIKFRPRKYPSLFLYSAQNKLLLYDDDEKHLPLFVKKCQ